MKTWYQSKTIWGVLISLAALLLNAGGIKIAPDDQGQLSDILVNLSGISGALLAIFGRIKASKGIEH